MTIGRLSARQVATALAEHAEVLSPELLPNGHRERYEWVCGNLSGAPPKKKGSLRVALRGIYQGRWRDWATGEHGDALDLVRETRDLDTGAAIAWATRWLGVNDAGVGKRSKPVSALTHRMRTTASRDERHIAWARQLWCRALPVDGTLVVRYLRSRAITIPTPPTIRFIADLKHGPSGRILPAMIAAVQGPDRRLRGIHRTFLTTDGSRKGDVSEPKLMLGMCSGAAVRLGSVARKVAVAEGIETALSIAQTCADLSVWAALSTSGMRALVLPPEVREVILCPDGDGPGESAATAVAQRFIAEGLEVWITRPPDGTDFNDLLKTQRRVAA